MKHQLAAGTLGKVDGQPCPENKRDEKAKKYREHVRVWSYSEETIRSKLKSWFDRFNGDHDDTIAADLFTTATEAAVLEQMGNASWVVDAMEKDELYTAIKPGAKSQTNLTFYVGARGAESKLEKGHHAIAHFANGGMRKSLADFLGMAGIARYNRNIRFRQWIASLDPKERRKIPTAFQRAPHFSNHLRLAFINKLAAEAGLKVPAHRNVESLPADNGEKFFSEYLFEELDREAHDVGHEKETMRCKCRLCAGRINPYQQRYQSTVVGTLPSAPSASDNNHLPPDQPPILENTIPIVQVAIQPQPPPTVTIAPLLAKNQDHSYGASFGYPPTRVQNGMMYNSWMGSQLTQFAQFGHTPGGIWCLPTDFVGKQHVGPYS